MIENIAQTMKRLENIVIENYSDSDKSEKLSERQQKRLESLKQKGVKRKENGTKNEIQDLRKRGPDVKVMENSDKIKKY